MESPSEDTLLPKRSQRQHHNTILTPLLPPLPVFKTKTASSILFPAFFHEEYDLPLRQEHDLPCSQKINRPERCIDVRQACVRKIRHPIPAGAVLIPVLRPRSSVHRQKQTHSVLGCPAPSPSPSPSPSPLSETCIRGGTHGKHCHNIVIEDEMMHTNQTLRPQFPDPKTLTNPSVSHALPPKVTPHNPIPPTSHLHRSIQHRQPPPHKRTVRIIPLHDPIPYRHPRRIHPIVPHPFKLPLAYEGLAVGEEAGGSGGAQPRGQLPFPPQLGWDGGGEDGGC